MSSDAASLQTAVHRVAARYALYFTLDDPNFHSNEVEFVAKIADLSLLAAAIDVLGIVGHRLVEIATDKVVEKAGALKTKLLSRLRAEKEKPATPIPESEQGEIAAAIALTLKALAQSDQGESTRALAAAEGAVANFAQSELAMPGRTAREYSISITREIKIAIGGPSGRQS
jgi:hypothetical protein